MDLWTAQYRYPGPYRLDITVKGQDPIGKEFAPTWDILKEYKKNGDKEKYTQQYLFKMYQSMGEAPKKWDDLLQQEFVVLVCFCPYPQFCHRYLLAEELVKLGAKYHGEIVDFSQWEKIPDRITNFKGEYAWLSNFHKVPITYQNITYASVEHMYQAWKRAPENRAAYANIDKPKTEAKGLPLGKEWHNGLKQEIMKIGLELKYQNPELRAKLLATKGIELVEGNRWHDNYWGNCTCYKCITIQGQNTLGKMIMDLRDKL